MHRCCITLRPWQCSLALAFEDENHDEQGQRRNRRRRDGCCFQSYAGKKHAGYGGCRSPAYGLSETHERVKSPLLPDRREVDRHAVDRNILGRCKAVDEHADKHQQAYLLRGAFDEHKRQQRERQAELCAKHPRSSSSHRQELVAVHEWSRDQLEGPGQDDDGQVRTDVAGADALAGQPDRY